MVYRKSYLKAGFEAGAKAAAEAKRVAKQKAVFILIYYRKRIVGNRSGRWMLMIVLHNFLSWIPSRDFR